MAQDTSGKKAAFLSAVVANALAFSSARNQMRVLIEELASDATINGIADADCVGANAHLTRTIVFNYVQGMPLEALLNNGAVATSNRLPNLLAVLPT